MPFIAIALIVAAAIGGGTSLAAQNSLPGDALWGFKVGVNENVRAALAAEGKSQADFDISAIEARMEEASKLAANGRLDAQAQAKIEANFDAHAKNVAAQVAKLQERGDYSAAADVAARFQATVASRASALAEAKVNAGAEGSANAQAALSGIIGRVQTTLDTASTLSADASAQAAANVDTGASGSTNGNSSSNSNNGNASTSVDANVQTGGGVRIDL